MNLIAFLSPTNLSEQKEEFFASKTYNPVLKYAWDTEETQKWIHENPEYRALAQALINQDSQLIVQEAKKVFQTEIRSDFLSTAKEIVSDVPEKFPVKPMESVVSAFEEAFKYFDLSEYVVEVVDKHGFNFRPAPSEKKIVMSKHLNLDFFSIDGEVKHELVHVIRYENGKYNNIPFAQNYLPTEEGLATYCQDYAGEDGHASLFQHACEYTMTEIALKGSLRDMTNYLQDLGFSLELAWQRAIRHKFGWMETEKPGDIMKPSMYFYHQQLVRHLTDEQRYRLFVGKIAQEQLLDFPEYQGKIPLSKLQDFYQFNNK